MTALPVRGAAVAAASEGAADPLAGAAGDGGAVGVLGPQPMTTASTTRTNGARADGTTRTSPSTVVINGPVMDRSSTTSPQVP